jgi:hypothetical protein
MKRLTFTEYGKWESPGLHAVVILEEDNIYIGFFIGSTWANPYRPSDPSKKTSMAYASIAPGKYRCRYSKTAHNGKPGFDISTLDGDFNGKVPTTAPNPNQNGEMYATHVDAHPADSDIWEGSAACLTIDIHCWSLLAKHWREGEAGELIVERIKS